MNSGEDLGLFEWFLFGLVLLTGGEMLIEADLAGDPVHEEDDDVESSECAFPRPPLMSCSA